MAKLRGTGKDPMGRYYEGLIFDVPAGTPEYEDLIASGVAEDAGPAPGYGGTKRKVEVANAVVRGDDLSTTEAREHAKEFLPDEDGNVKTSPHDVVHSDGGVFDTEPNTTVPAVTAEAQHEAAVSPGEGRAAAAEPAKVGAGKSKS